MEEPKEPIAVVAALIVKEGKVLVAQRPPGKQQALKWEFPGGKIEPGETAPQALSREIREELGVTVVVGQALPEHLHDYGTIRIRLIPFLCTLPGDHPAPKATEHVALDWKTKEELSILDLAPADLPILEDWNP